MPAYQNAGSIRQRKDGRWEARLSVGVDFATGRPKRISRYAATREEAEELLRCMQNEASFDPDNLRLGTWLETWLTVYMKNAIKQSTYISYETYIRRHFMPALGNLRLKELTPRLLQSFYNFKFQQEGLAPKTIVNINLCLHKALDQAQKEGLIPTNPASAINLPRGERPEIEVLTLDEQARLVQASYRHRYGIFVRLVLVTGLRMGELLGLKWEDIDFRAGMLYVRRTLNRLPKPDLTDGHQGLRTEIVLQEPKTRNSRRSIPLLPALVQELHQWRSVQQADRAACPSYRDSGMVVTNPFGGYIEPRTFRDYYLSMLKDAGLGHFTFHALRHTFATRAMERGMDPKTLSTLMGHYSVSFTLDTYAHVLDEHKREGMKLMDDLYHVGLQQTMTYPVIATRREDGYALTAPDFPSITDFAFTLDEGVQRMQDRIQEEVLTSSCSIPATDPAMLSLQPGQMVVQVVS